MLNLSQFVEALRKKGEVLHIQREVDPHLELAEIHRRVIEKGGPALFFHKVKGSSFPVVTNLFGTKDRVDIAFGHRPKELVAEIVELLTKKFPLSIKTIFESRKTLTPFLRLGTKKVSRAPILECEIKGGGLNRLPLIKSWPEDGGDFITLPLVYTEPISGKGAPNLGMYRIQRYGDDETGLHWQIGKGGGYHHFEAEKQGKALPVSIFIGGPPALILSAIAPLPENVPEMLLASLVLGEKLKMTKDPSHPHLMPAQAEFVLQGECLPNVRRLEGPFGDHYGYYSLAHDFPVFKLKKMYHRKGAIFPATVVGKPFQEDYFIGNYLTELLSPLFPVVMPGVKKLQSYGECGFHSLASAVVHERYVRESMVSAFRILGEGQLSFSKFLILTDQEVDLTDFKALLTVVLERFEPQKDLFIFSNLSLDTLDYTGPKLNEGSRGILLGLGKEKKRNLSTNLPKNLPSCVRRSQFYCPGCLVVEVASYDTFADFESFFSVSEIPLILLVDSLEETLKDQTSFLWTVFTRFEPAADIHAKSSIFRHHFCYELPIVVDARQKPSYPKVVKADDATLKLVDNSHFDYV